MSESFNELQRPFSVQHFVYGHWKLSVLKGLHATSLKFEGIL